MSSFSMSSFLSNSLSLLMQLVLKLNSSCHDDQLLFNNTQSKVEFFRSLSRNQHFTESCHVSYLLNSPKQTFMLKIYPIHSNRWNRIYRKEFMRLSQVPLKDFKKIMGKILVIMETHNNHQFNCGDTVVIVFGENIFIEIENFSKYFMHIGSSSVSQTFLSLNTQSMDIYSS